MLRHLLQMTQLVCGKAKSSFLLTPIQGLLTSPQLLRKAITMCDVILQNQVILKQSKIPGKQG